MRARHLPQIQADQCDARKLGEAQAKAMVAKGARLEGIPGAQEPETFVSVLNRVRERLAGQG